MDQTLVNFLYGAKKALGKEFNNPSFTSDAEKWKLLRETTPKFWLNLEWMPEARRIWEFVKDKNPHILSACPDPADYPECPQEKIQWCVRELGISEDRVHCVSRREKKNYAVSDDGSNLLIDDHPKTIQEWRDAGGLAILHRTVPETLEVLENLKIGSFLCTTKNS